MRSTTPWWRRPAVGAGLGVVLVAWVWAISMPTLSYVDEDSHVVYAAAVVRGDVLGEVRTLDPDDSSDRRRTLTEVSVPAAYGQIGLLPACHKFNWEQPADCAPPPPPVAGPEVPVLTPAGTYQPVYYGLIGWPSWFLSPGRALLAMRLVSGVLVAVALGAAVASLARLGGPGWRWVGFGLALTPTAVHLFGAANPNGLEIALAVLVWAASLELLVGSPTTAGTWRLGIGGGALAMTRPVSFVWAGAIPAASVVYAGTRQRLVALWHRRDVRLALTALAVAVAATLLWMLARGTLSSFNGTPAPDAVGIDAARQSFGMTFERIEQMVSRLGWIDVLLPRTVVWFWYAAVPVLVVAAAWVGSGRARLVLAALAVGIVALPVVTETRTAADIGFTWQGRYTLPIAAGLPLVAGVELDRRVRHGARAAPMLFAAVLAVQILALAAAFRRYEVGYPSSLVSFLGDAARWEPPVNDLWLLGLLGVGLGCLWWACVQSSSGDSELDRASSEDGW